MISINHKFKNPDDGEIRLRSQRFAGHPSSRFYLDFGGSTSQTAYNQQTSVQTAGNAVVTGAGNTGVSNSSGTIIQGSGNNVNITTADPAIVQSALESNQLIATEALSTYDHLVTGQTSGQLQALADTNASNNALLADQENASSPVSAAVNSKPATTSTYTPPVTSSSSTYVVPGLIILALVGLGIYFWKGKKL